MIYVLLRHALKVTFVLCVLWQKKRPTFLHRWFQGYIENCSDFLGTSCVSRLGKEEHSESFPNLVTSLMPCILLCFLFLSFQLHLLFVWKMGKFLLQDIPCFFSLYCSNDGSHKPRKDCFGQM